MQHALHALSEAPPRGRGGRSRRRGPGAPAATSGPPIAIVGIGLGVGEGDGAPRGVPCLQVFVDAWSDEPSARMSPVDVCGRTLPVEVYRVESAELHLGVGHGIGAGTRNLGSVTGFLKDALGNVYVLSAAHVLGESFIRNVPPSERRRPVLVGDDIYDYGPLGVTPPSGTAPVGFMQDRSPLDFAGHFPRQNIDAAIARLASDPGLEPADIPYGEPAWVRLGDEVRVLGVGTRGASSPGPVFSVDFGTAAPVFRYADPDGLLRPVLIHDLCLAQYTSVGGDSGGVVVRTSDRRAVGLHIGEMTVTADGDATTYGVFIELPRVLGRWPDLQLCWNPNPPA